MLKQFTEVWTVALPPKSNISVCHPSPVGSFSDTSMFTFSVRFAFTWCPLNAISLYIQKHCSKIENFISYTINNNNWGDETEWNWDSESLREYLIDKYKYKWLENAETKEYYDPTILRFFNKKNIMSLYT